MNKTRTLPHDKSLEEATIGVLLTLPTLVGEVISLVDSSAFHDPFCRAVFEVIGSAYCEGRGIDLNTISVAVAPEFPGLDTRSGLLRMLEAESLASSSTLKEYSRLLEGMARKRRLIQVAHEIAEVGYDGTAPDEAEAQALSLVLDLSRGRESGSYSPIGRVLDTTGEIITTHLENPREILGLDSGLATLNGVLGGVQATNLIVVAGRPSVGKSAMASTLALNVARNGKRVAVHSLEMGQVRLTRRFLSSMTQVPATKIRRGTVTEEEKTRVYDALTDLRMLPLLVDCRTDITSVQVAAKAREIARRGGLDMLVVDYLGLLADTDDNEVRRLGNITRTLKALAVDLEIPVVALHQLSRNLEHRASKVPTLADLRGSGRIEEDADIVLMLHRADYQKADQDPVSKVDVLVRKNRDGPTGRFELAFNKTTLTFRDMERRRT